MDHSYAHSAKGIEHEEHTGRGDVRNAAGGGAETSPPKEDVRGTFVHAVAGAVDRLMKEHGCNRDKAASMVLREIEGVPLSQSEDELNRVKQHYRLAHFEASRALAVSSAIHKLTQAGSSHVEAVSELTERLSKATFTNRSHRETEHPVATTTAETTTRKATEISLPAIPKPSAPAQPLLPSERRKSPQKRLKGKAKPPSSKPSRKRSIDELVMETVEQRENAQRPRSDSVSEAVSAKAAKHHQQQTESSSSSNPEKTTTARAKRTRSLETVEGGPPAIKRTRPTTA